MPKFNSIIPFVSSASYSVQTDWRYLKDTLERLKGRYINDIDQKDGLDMDPDFQRGHVWTEEQQIRYIEYALKGGRSGRDIYWNNPSWMGSYSAKTVLIDGKQRITAALRFIDNEIPAFGYLFKDWEGIPANATFIFHINKLKTRAEVLQWYLDLNAGGTPHSKEELSRVRDLLAKE